MKGPLSFFPNDRAKDVDPLTMEERGMYFTVMRHQWPNGGPIPMDEVDRLIEKPWLSTRDVFRRRFVETGSCISLLWVEEEREKRALFSEQQSAKGKLGGRPAKGKKLKKTHGFTEQKPGESPRVGKGIGRVVEQEREVVFPAWATSKFMDKWALWKAYKVEKRSPYKPIGEQSALMKLAKDFPGEAEAIAAIENSMGQNYQGIFAANGNGKKVLTNDEYRNQVIAATEQRFGGK